MTDDDPFWTLEIKMTDDGITQVSFTVDTYEPMTDIYEAMRHLAAVSLWWLDTGQHEKMGIVL